MGKKIQTIGRYNMLGHTLGKGAFARVEMAVHSVTQIKVGIKIIDTRKFVDQQARELFNREAKILSQLNHPNIVRMYETLKAGSLYCIVTEYAPGGELLGYVRSFKEERLTESQARPFVRQLVSALNYMHERGVVHRDLKMENILLDEAKKTLKIIDFGLSNVCAAGQLLKTHCGSPEYAAPELLSPKKGYGHEVDLWSLGIIVYALVTGRLPFWSPYADHGRKQKLLEQIEKGLTDKHEAVMKNLSNDCRHLIKQLVEPNPLHRIPLKEVMQHPWITRNGKMPFVPFKSLPRNHAMRLTVCEKLSQLMKMDRTEIESIIVENRAHEITVMFNLLMDDARRGTEYAELDHTLPITYFIAEPPKRSAVDNWKLIKNSIHLSPQQSQCIANHFTQIAAQNGPAKPQTNSVTKGPVRTGRPTFLHLSSADNVLAGNSKDKPECADVAECQVPANDANAAPSQGEPVAAAAAAAAAAAKHDKKRSKDAAPRRRERSEGSNAHAHTKKHNILERAKAVLPDVDYSRAPKAQADDDVLSERYNAEAPTPAPPPDVKAAEPLTESSNSRDAEEAEHLGDAQATKFTLDTNTIDIIVSKLLVAAGKQPSILQHLLAETNGQARDHWTNKQQLLNVQPSPPVLRFNAKRITSPEPTARRAKSCVAQRDEQDGDAVHHTRMKRNSSSQKFNCVMTQTERERQLIDTPRGKRKRHVRKKRKQKVVFLQHSPSSERWRSESFDADDEGEDERRRSKVQSKQRCTKLEQPAVCSRCSCSSSATTLLQHHQANSSDNLVQARSALRVYNGERDQFCSMFNSHQFAQCGVKRDSVTIHARKNVTMVQSFSQEPVVS